VRSGDDPARGVDPREIRVFEIADVVVADQVGARLLFALEQRVAFEVERRVPAELLGDLAAATAPP